MKIALVGSAPSSVRLAPYRDASWKIWGCSPGAYAVVERADAWFEMHRWEPPVIGRADLQVPWFSPEYMLWLAQFKGDVYMAENVPEVPNALTLPWERLVDEYGPYFMNSSLSWMLAFALEQPGIEEIGLWGVDMSATEEYGYQRAGCHHFITLAQKRGIKITVPPESDLLMPKPLYGVGENHPMMVKLTARGRELDGRIMGARQRLEAARDEVNFLNGAKDNLNYQVQTFSATAMLEGYFARLDAAAAAKAAAPPEKPPA